MFETLKILPPDPILGLSQEYTQSQHPNKVNLSVGIYKADSGNTPIFRAVKTAEQRLIDAQNSKVYIAQQGDPQFLSGMHKLLLGDELSQSLQDRSSICMTPGGCGALRLVAETVFNANPNATIWFSSPTWGNHFPLIESAGLKTAEYPYYDKGTGLVDFDAMLAELEKVPAGDLVLLHACCHNPTGADLNQQQWDQVIDLAERQGFIPWFDIAYQGFSQSLDADAYSVRAAAKRLPEVLIVASCSKNFGLYRERTGAALFINKNAKETKAAQTNAISLMRKSYSMSPYHGGGIVGTILNDADLTKIWQDEIAEVCQHVQSLRQIFAEQLNQKQSKKDFSFITQNRGMFSYLGIELEEVLKLRNEHGVYILNSTRMNVAGLSSLNINYVTDSVAAVLNC